MASEMTIQRDKRSRVLASNPQLTLMETKAHLNTFNEYNEDIFAAMKYSEKQNAPSLRSFNSQQELTYEMRLLLIDFIIDKCFKLKLSQTTLYLTVNLIDRYCSTRQLNKAHLQLLGLTCLWIASKYNDNKYRILQLADLVDFSNNQFSKKLFKEMESHVLENLGWSISSPTHDLFVDYYLNKSFFSSKKSACSNETSLIETYYFNYLKIGANFLCELSLMYPTISLTYKPSKVAFVALLIMNNCYNAEYNDKLNVPADDSNKDLFYLLLDCFEHRFPNSFYLKYFTQNSKKRKINTIPSNNPYILKNCLTFTMIYSSIIAYIKLLHDSIRPSQITEPASSTKQYSNTTISSPYSASSSAASKTEINDKCNSLCSNSSLYSSSSSVFSSVSAKSSTSSINSPLSSLSSPNVSLLNTTSTTNHSLYYHPNTVATTAPTTAPTISTSNTHNKTLSSNQEYTPTLDENYYSRPLSSNSRSYYQQQRTSSYSEGIGTNPYINNSATYTNSALRRLSLALYHTTKPTSSIPIPLMINHGTSSLAHGYTSYNYNNSNYNNSNTHCSVAPLPNVLASTTVNLPSIPIPVPLAPFPAKSSSTSIRLPPVYDYKELLKPTRKPMPYAVSAKPSLVSLSSAYNGYGKSDDADSTPNCNGIVKPALNSKKSYDEMADVTLFSNPDFYYKKNKKLKVLSSNNDTS